MQRGEISQKIVNFLEKQTPGQSGTLDENAHLLEDWFLESLQLLETVMFLETEFDIRISRADITGNNFATVATITDFVAQSLGR